MRGQLNHFAALNNTGPEGDAYDIAPAARVHLTNAINSAVEPMMPTSNAVMKGLTQAAKQSVQLADAAGKAAQAAQVAPGKGL
jgi:hypothetical protein